MKLKLFASFLSGVIITIIINHFLFREVRFKHDNLFINSQIEKNEDKLEILNRSELNPFLYDSYNRFVLKLDSIVSSSKNHNVLGEEFYKIIPPFLNFDKSEVVNLINTSIGNDGFKTKFL